MWGRIFQAVNRLAERRRYERTHCVECGTPVPDGANFCSDACADSNNFRMAY